MRFASLIDRFERLRARTAKRVEALSAASTGWRMNRKVGLTFGAIVLAMVVLGLVSVGSLAVIRSSVGGVTESICASNWGTTLSNIGLNTFGLRRPFTLSSNQVVSTIQVHVTAVVSPCCSNSHVPVPANWPCATVRR